MNDKVINTVSFLREMQLTPDEWTLAQLQLNKDFNINTYALMQDRRTDNIMLCGTSTPTHQRQIRGLEMLGSRCVGTICSDLSLAALQKGLKASGYEPPRNQHYIEADNGDRIIIIERRRDCI